MNEEEDETYIREDFATEEDWKAYKREAIQPKVDKKLFLVSTIAPFVAGYNTPEFRANAKSVELTPSELERIEMWGRLYISFCKETPTKTEADKAILKKLESL